MYRTIHKANYDLSDVQVFIGELEKSASEFFDKNREIFIARAPGRLDVMGGIGDYSGSLVLEMPIAEAVLVALQKDNDLTLTIVSRDGEDDLSFEMPLGDLKKDGELIDYAEIQSYFLKDTADHWAAYIAGVLYVLMREKNIEFQQGSRLYISSDVPQGKGVSSSAALEAAVMKVVMSAFDIEIEPREAALLCQKVENLVVGAPCGVMDQMSVFGGRENELLAIICQPAELRGTVKIPEEVAFWGIDSGIRHSVVGADYGSVRTGAFMGYRIIADLAELPIQSIGKKVEIIDEKWSGYPANITPAEFEKDYKNKIPAEISGADFLQKYIGITDPVTRVLPEKIYAVLNPTAHPVYENARVKRFAELLEGKISEDVLTELGELMLASHESYSACGLGSDGTNLLVELVKKIGKEKGLYGAKITGGGSGGTVAILGLKDASQTIAEVASEYEKQTNHTPYIFSGSSPGAEDFGFLKISM